jgi:uncharacterized protein (DUF111 family)
MGSLKAIGSLKRTWHGKLEALTRLDVESQHHHHHHHHHHYLKMRERVCMRLEERERHKEEKIFKVFLRLSPLSAFIYSP